MVHSIDFIKNFFLVKDFSLAYSSEHVQIFYLLRIFPKTLPLMEMQHIQQNTNIMTAYHALFALLSKNCLDRSLTTGIVSRHDCVETV